MINSCPQCEASYDWDGFYEHKVETLYCCSCQAIFDVNGRMYAKEDIDWTDLHFNWDDLPGVGGIFIKASRLKPQITSTNYENNLIELERLMTLEPKPGTAEATQLDKLVEALLAYEKKHFKKFFASTYIKKP